MGLSDGLPSGVINLLKYEDDCRRGSTPRLDSGGAVGEIEMSLERDLRVEQVAHLDLSFFTTAPSGALVGAVLARMRREGHGCALITEGSRLVGIFTERDALLKVIDRPETWTGPIDTVMTCEPNTVQPTDSVAAALHLMNRGHYRNVPVVAADGNIVGNLTHYAILKFFSDRFQPEIYNLPPDPEVPTYRGKKSWISMGLAAIGVTLVAFASVMLGDGAKETSR